MSANEPSATGSTSAADDRHFESIYRRHFPRVASYLLARTDPHSAEEALGRTFEIAWRRVSDLPADPLPWLFGIARRVLAQQRGIMKAYVADGANQLTERSGQITRFFYYSTRGSLGFDSGLLDRPELPPAKPKETPPPNPNVNKPRAIYYIYKGKTPKS
jgi:hypothetical protein